jgi:hypothetical protein
VRVFILASDPRETKDLTAAMPEKVKKLQSKWDAWNVVNVKPLWGGGNSDSDGDEPGVPVQGRKNARAKP